ncbi:MAG: lamin tail domain-containing protein [bacterium]|nr:lamin tail domain-containing protein [bacterium]
MQRKLSLWLTLGLFAAAGAWPADTANVLAGGIALNEVLVDPNSSGGENFDTDGNGTADTLDEFVEVYNLSGAPIDISGFELWDSGSDLWFTFPATTTLGAGNFAVVVCGVQAGGALPPVSGGNLAFDAGRTSGAINNGGDNVVLYDPNNDQYIQFLYNGDGADNPPVDYLGDGFSGTATLVGAVEDWGFDTDGISLVRDPAGDTNVVLHTASPTPGNASPGYPVELMSFTVE